MKCKSILFYLLLFYISILYFDNIFLITQYYLENGTIPYNRVDSKVSIGFIIYLKIILMLLWNLSWMLFLFRKNKYVLYIIIMEILILISGIIIANSTIESIYFVFADIRILNGINAAIGIILIVQYFINNKNYFSIDNISRIIILFTLIDAIISIIEFYIIGFNFGFRIMGIFANSQLNAFILLISIILLYYMYLYKSISKIYFLIYFLIFSIALITTGTRAVMLAFILIVFISFADKLSTLNNNKNFKIIIILGFLLVITFTLPSLLNYIDSLANRGSMLNQSDGGRINKLYNIIYGLSDEGTITFLIGKGVGWGSNAVTSLFKDFVGIYGTVDGTIQYLLVRFGILGLIIFPLFYIVLYIHIKRGKGTSVSLLIAIFAISMSVNIFEIYLLLIIIGVIIAYIKQKQYIEDY